MKKMNLIAALLLVAGLATAQSTWKIDKSHSKVGFSVVHMVVSEVEGKFNDFDGTVVSKSDDFNGAEVEFSAKIASIDTDNEKRDGHLKSADFFDAEKFADIKFKGNLVKEGGKYLLKGKFTMKDVTKDVTFNVTYGGTVNTGRGFKAGFNLNGSINRQDYGVKWANKLQDGGAVVSDEVTIICKLELDKQVVN
jgi:polyisoprenoid-binding protein YceI